MIASFRSVLLTAALLAAGAAASGSPDLSLHVGGSGFDLNWTTLPGVFYAIETSSGLQAWETLESGILAGGDTMLRTVPEPAEYPVFYRIRSNAFVDPATPSNAQPYLVNPTGDNWVLEFSDEFNGTGVDTTKWNIDNSTRSRAARPEQGINDWWWKPSNVSVSGGDLVLDVTKRDHNTMWCGSVNSNNKYEPTYGFLEARIQIADTTKSTHTAFWLQGDNMSHVDGTGNDGAEVDIFESAWFGDYTKSVVHIDGYGSAHKANTKQYSTPGLHSGYHVFGLEWNASGMKIYYDGVLKVSYTGQWVPQVPEFLWLSDGASFGDVGTFTSEPTGWLTAARVDYVRVWKSK